MYSRHSHLNCVLCAPQHCHLSEFSLKPVGEAETHHAGSASLQILKDNDKSDPRFLHIFLRWDKCRHCTLLQMLHSIYRQFAGTPATVHFYRVMWKSSTYALTMKTAHLIFLLCPSRTALIDCVQIHAIHLLIRHVVCCPEEETDEV